MTRDYKKIPLKEDTYTPGSYLLLPRTVLGNLLSVLPIFALFLILISLTAPVHAETSADLVGQGNVLLNQGRISQAISTFDAALAANPHSLPARVGKGTALAASSRPSESLLQFEIALSENPTYLPALLEKGRVELSTGNANEALVSYTQALSQDPGNRQALEGKGDALLALGRGGEAIDSWNTALRYDPANTRIQEKITAARNANETGMFLWIGIIAIVVAAIAISIWYLAIFRTRASSGKRNPSQKSRRADTPLPPIPGKPVSPALRSRPEKRTGPGITGTRHFARIQRMLKGTLKNPRALIGMSGTVQTIPGTPRPVATPVPDPVPCSPEMDLPVPDPGDPAPSLSPSGSVGDITHSLQVLLNTSDCKYSGDGLKGILLYSNREYVAAIREFDREIAIYPDVICISLLKVRALMHLGRFSDALDLDRVIMRNTPNNFEAAALGAVLADYLGQTDFALRACNTATEIRHNSPIMWALKGTLYRKSGRYPDALAALQQSISLDDDSEITWKEYGDVLSRIGQYPEAIQAFEKVLSLAGDDPKIRARIDTCREKLKPPETKESAIPQNPGNPPNQGLSRGSPTEKGDSHGSRFHDSGVFSPYDHHTWVDRPDPAGHDRDPRISKG